MAENKRLENEKKMINLLKGGATLSQLKEEMKYNDYQLSLKLASLENKGYLIRRSYHTDKVVFTINYNLNRNSNYIPIRMNEEPSFNCLMIADTHIGAHHENLDALKSLYQYAFSNHMNHVFHLGDLIEGISSNQNQKSKNKFNNVIDNVEYAIKNYPKMNSVHTTLILGNHDFFSVQCDGFNISKMIMRKRADINVLCYKSAMLNILDKKIVLEHPNSTQLHEENITDGFKQPNGTEVDFLFRGHLHRSNITKYQNTQVIYVPCLSGENTSIGAWNCNFFANENRINRVILKPLMVFPNNQVVEATNITLNYGIGKSQKAKNIENENKTNFDELNQIEKFQKRYEKKKKR